VIRTDRAKYTRARRAFRHSRYDRVLAQGIRQYRAGLMADALKSFEQVARAGNKDQKEKARKYIARLHRKPLGAGQGVDAPDKTALVSGHIKSENAWRLHKPMEPVKLRQSIFLSHTRALSNAFSYQVSGRYFYDAIFDATGRYPRAVRDDEKKEAELRDAFVDLNWRAFDLRLGKQQVVWGESVGLFYADVVNARDLREFILPDFDWIRVPQWMADLEYSGGWYHAEFVWSPAPAFDRLPRLGAEWALPLPVSTAALAGINDEIEPAGQPRNGALGGRLGVQLAGWDLGLIHWSGWDKMPALRRSTSAAGVALTPIHTRLATRGATLSKEIGGIVFRGEGIYQSGKHFSTADPADADGLVERNLWDYYVGADATFFERFDLTLQAGRRYIQGFTPDIVGQKRFTNNYVGSLRTGFWSNTVELSGTVIMNASPTNYLARPKIALRLGERLTLSGGVDVFRGRADTLFGFFNNRDRVYGELRLDF
jgi:hypothetical protein